MADASSPDPGVPIGSQGVGRRSLLRGLAGTGVVVAVSGALSIASETPASAAVQDLWAWCYKCQGLWYANWNSGRCPALREPWPDYHLNTGSGNYTLVIDGGTGQQGWRWCRLCMGLWFAYNGTAGHCPGNRPGGGHVLDGSGDYRLDVHAGVGEQAGWLWCSQCQGLWYGLNGTNGWCPIGVNARHTGAGSGNYYLLKS
jgi:hypothetical protein